MRRLLAIASLALAGCAELGKADCVGDWYAIGQRDGTLGASPQAANYAARCGAVDDARYREGWEEAYRRRGRLGA